MVYTVFHYYYQTCIAKYIHMKVRYRRQILHMLIQSYTFITGSHGLIEFSIAYDETTTNLLVNVIKAKVIILSIKIVWKAGQTVLMYLIVSAHWYQSI